eukprot:jgi/Chlat1/167/Chrsp1S03242
MEELWKEVYLVGTEWEHYNTVYETPWDFSNLEEAFDEGGVLHNKRVYAFGVTEPQLLQSGDGEDGKWKVTHIPAIVAVTSPTPPSDQLSIKSVQMEGDGTLLKLKDMKMDWVPFIPDTRKQVERTKPQVFVLKCILRRAALKRLSEAQVKKYEYCLPYIYQPLKEEQFQYDSTVSLMFPLEDPQPPVVAEFDWQFDTVENFCRTEVNAAKAKVREAKAKRKAELEALTDDSKKVMEDMRFYKFYPVKSDNYPDISGFKSSFINRYYGKAHEVF